jgi:hypothetical protein
MIAVRPVLLPMSSWRGQGDFKLLLLPYGPKFPNGLVPSVVQQCRVLWLTTAVWGLLARGRVCINRVDFQQELTQWQYTGC